MSNYLQLKVVAVTRETPDAITIYLEHPESKAISYKAGQFLTLIIPFNGKKERRSFSLSSAPYEAPRLAVTVKRVPGGKVSNYLVNKCAVGTLIEVMEPMGKFNIDTNSNNSRNLVLIGAGSGITPLISMAKAVLHDEPKSKVTLIYGNRHQGTIIYKDKLNELVTQYAGRLVVEHVLSQPRQAVALPKKSSQKSPGKLSFTDRLKALIKPTTPTEWAQPEPSSLEDIKYTGRLNRTMLLDILDNLNLKDHLHTEYYLCGPTGLMQEACEALKTLKVEPEQIHQELFVANHGDTNRPPGEVTAEETEKDTADCRVVTLLYEGAEYKVKVNKSQTILEAVLAQNIDLPYSCQAGLCTACRGKCLSGKVFLDDSDGLSEDEIKEGYVLNCVGHPISEDVVIEIG